MKKSFKKYNNPVLLFNNGIGDHIINLPAIRAISIFYDGDLTFVCAKKCFELFYTDLKLRKTVSIDFFISEGNRAFHAEELIQEIENCDLLIYLNPWDSNEIDKFIKYFSPTTIGFFERFDHFIEPNSTKHSSEQAFEISKFINPNADINDFSYEPFLPNIGLIKANEIMKILPKDYMSLVIHADTLIEKMWDSASFNEFIESFLTKHKKFVIFLVGAKDIGLNSVKNKSRFISCIGLSLEISISLLSKANLFVGVDSCMLHIADIFKIQSIAIFVSTNSNEYGFRISKKSKIINNPKSYRPVINLIDNLIENT